MISIEEIYKFITKRMIDLAINNNLMCDKLYIILS